MLFVVSGPSGCGKSTLIARVLAAVPRLRFSVSHTTRAPRAGEADGREYHFVTEPEFRAMAARREFLEHAEVHGHLYGTSRREVEERASGEDVLLDIDVQGALQVKRSGLAAVSVFVLPPARKVLEERLRARGTDSPEAIEVRLANAAREILQFREFDYIVVNLDLETAVDELRSIVVAQRCRTRFKASHALAIIGTFAFGEGGGPAAPGSPAAKRGKTP